MSLGLRFGVTGDDLMVRYLREFPKVARKASKLSINDTIRRGRRMTKQEVMTQVNLPSSYLNQTRLSENFATEDNLVGSIVGRRRPTSLARFGAEQLYQSNKTRPGRKPAGVSVRVKNRRKTIPNAFLVKLKAGNRDGVNQGLAVRLPKGQRPDRRFGGKPLYKNQSTNVWLLYGPSVNQMMISSRSGKSIVETLKPRLDTYLSQEFRRQFGRLYRG
ncbi:hypothetical protein [Marinobacter phage PS6]|uniref:hypothetical protein n=1 Tax=Marinobacter sp. DS40M6 TaxID=1597776 RepID=UPI000C0C4FB2|nr:hypothetical protein [Marinobacter sp. DS40M6]ATN93245.1 hypothetical protein [Marinobacter phage PS6]MDC8457824.1 hypothetical protein [Marinobacter sp. DS40M6]